MNTKLTLTIEEDIIKRAKEFAKEQNRSLSDIVENYFKAITANKIKNKTDELSPITRSLRGSLKLDSNIDYKEELAKRLEEKYLK